MYLTQRAKMSTRIDPKIVELTADAFRMFFKLPSSENMYLVFHNPCTGIIERRYVGVRARTSSYFVSLGVLISSGDVCMRVITVEAHAARWQIKPITLSHCTAVGVYVEVFFFQRLSHSSLPTLFLCASRFLHIVHDHGTYFIKNILRTSAVSSTNFRSILVFASCVVGTCNILYVYYAWANKIFAVRVMIP